MASASTHAAATAAAANMSELRASLARFPAEIAAADAVVAAELRTAQKQAERELERIVGPASDRLIVAARRDD